MLRVFGPPMSTCTRKVLMTLAENETPYELNVVDFAKGEHKAQPHLGRLRLLRVARDLPLPQREGVGEARAERPEGPRADGELDQHRDLQLHAPRDEVHLPLHVQRPQDDAVLAAAEKSLDSAFAVMDAQLAKTPYLAGDEFTLADVCFMPYLEYGMGTPIKEQLAKYPHVSAWWNKVSERPTWQKTAGRPS